MKSIFSFFLLVPGLMLAQSFDASNEAAIGDLVSLHLCDSNANIQANVMGSNAVWDFSTISGIFGVTKDVQVLDATLDANYASFAGATKLYDIGGTLQTFYSTSAAGRISQGFVFNEVSLGAVVASWSTDQENLMNYPYGFGANPVLDVFSGTVTSTATGTLPASGTSATLVDGIGTLQLPGGNTYTNVLRFHLKDSAVASVFGTNVAFIRNVYEYYDFTVSNLPIFLTMKVDVNSALIMNSSTVILSKHQPLTFVGLTEDSPSKVAVYPNPVIDALTLEGVNENEPYTITSVTGKIVNSGTYTGPIDVTNLLAGVYLLRINNQTVEFIK